MKLGSFIAPPCKEKYRSYHGSIIEKERQLFSFWDFYLFEVIILISQRFPNGLKPKCVSDFISFNFVNIMQLIFIFFSTRYFGEIEMYVAWFVKNQIHLFTFCRQMPVFPNNSCQICLTWLETGMLYHMNNNFRHTVLEVSFPVSYSHQRRV